jgi:hypothetical protein
MFAYFRPKAAIRGLRAGYRGLFSTLLLRRRALSAFPDLGDRRSRIVRHAPVFGFSARPELPRLDVGSGDDEIAANHLHSERGHRSPRRPGIQRQVWRNCDGSGIGSSWGVAGPVSDRSRMGISCTATPHEKLQWQELGKPRAAAGDGVRCRRGPREPPVSWSRLLESTT